MYNWFKGNPEDFNFQKQEIAGDLCVLITPKDITVKWNDDNKIYRSSIWRVSDGFPVSLGYRKFVNFQEQPSFEPIDDNSEYPVIVEKVDGSCIICSYYKGQLIVRTRGTFDAFKAFPDNEKELRRLINWYDVEKKFEYEQLSIVPKSFIFEYVSPNNQIVKKYDKPDLILTGIIYHEDYSYATQTVLDIVAKTQIDGFGILKRPKTYSLSLCASDASKFFKELKDNTEGAVCYFNNGQTLKKMKTEWYLNLHHLRFAFRSPKNIFQYIIDNNLINFSLSKEEFKKSVIDNLSEHFDYEVISYIKPFIEEVSDNIFDKVIEKIITHKEYYKQLPEECQVKDVIKLINTTPDIIDSLIWLQYRGKPFDNKVYKNLFKL